MTMISNQAIRALVVDDEALARRGIEIRLAAHADIAIVGSCANGREAVAAVTKQQPDLMFLDIQMPGLSGLEVLEQLPRESLPMIIFVTAFDRYALDAFDAQALDYVLKPIDEARFAQALERVRLQWQQRNASAQRDQLVRLLAATRGSTTLDEQTVADYLRDAGQQRFPRILPIRDESGTLRLEIQSIEWIDAAGDYMCVHAGGRTYVLRETMKSLEAILDPSIFQRVHRSTIVNLERVRRLRPHTNGEYFLILEDGQEIKLSRSYRDRIDQLLQRK